MKIKKLRAKGKITPGPISLLKPGDIPDFMSSAAPESIPETKRPWKTWLAISSGPSFSLTGSSISRMRSGWTIEAFLRN
jgi:hypothetical protein